MVGVQDELHEAMGMDPPEAIAELEEELQQLEDVMAEEEKLALPTAPTVRSLFLIALTSVYNAFRRKWKSHQLQWQSRTESSPRKRHL